MSDDRTPILIGAGQAIQRDIDPAEAREPVELMIEAAERAADDAGLGLRGLARADRVGVVNVFCWSYGNAPRLLAERLGAQPREEIYTTVGGNSPQALVSDTAQAIADGRVRLALLAGGEALATQRRAGQARTQLPWTPGGGGKPTVLGTDRMGMSDHELAHGLALPVQIYPLFENAIRAHLGRGLAAHQAKLGELLARFSAVAAANPYAWFRQPRSAAEIATVTPRNRMIAFPYPKLMNAIIEVDQAAALLMTSVGAARELGIPRSRWIYVLGAADAHDHWFLSGRLDYRSSPAIRAAGRDALAAAGASIEDIERFDLYSCFPCAVEIARDMLGIPEDDPRPLTTTGGLAAFGGPGNNYSMHAIASMIEQLRAAPGAKGLVSALGWFVTKHSIGVYGSEPGAHPFRRADAAALQAEIDRDASPALAVEPSGRATIETYTVLHDRDGAPTGGIVVGRLADGRRFLARAPADRAVLEGLTTREGVGVPGLASPGDGANRFDPT